VEFVVDKVALRKVFSKYLGFPCQFSFHRLLHTDHHLSSWSDTIGQTVADVPSGLSLKPESADEGIFIILLQQQLEKFLA
jgi:hypothetical protein